MDKDPVDAALDVRNSVTDNTCTTIKHLLIEAKQLGKVVLRLVNLVRRVEVNDDTVNADVKVQSHDVFSVSVFPSLFLNELIDVGIVIHPNGESNCFHPPLPIFLRYLKLLLYSSHYITGTTHGRRSSPAFWRTSPFRVVGGWRKIVKSCDFWFLLSGYNLARLESNNKLKPIEYIWSKF